jgi:hypothetical protein
MTMAKQGEIDALRKLVDEVLPLVEQAECERLPVAYQGLAKGIVAALGPALHAQLDAMVAKIPVDPAP